MSATYNFTVTRTDNMMARSSFMLTEEQLAAVSDRGALINMYIQEAMRGLDEVIAAKAPELAGAA